MEPTIQPLQKWLSGRKETITELRKLADDLDKKYKTCNKVGIAGATLGVVAAGKKPLKSWLSDPNSPKHYMKFGFNRPD